MTHAGTGGLLEGYSLEMTAKDIASLRDARANIPSGTPISVTFLPGEDLPSRVAAALAVKECGFVPVSHLSARRLSSLEDLTSFLAALKDRVGIERAFVVAGDPPQPLGPFDDALAVIQRGDLSDYGIRRVGISGYPEGHPDIPQAKLWDALKAKHKALVEGGYTAEIVTQFGFDSEAVLHWLELLRQEANIHVKVRIGLPGPASVKTLLRFATRCGVGASARVMLKYGVSITKLLNTAGPDRLIEDFNERLRPTVHGDVKFHLYPFGGLKPTTEWARDYRFSEPVGRWSESEVSQTGS